MCSKHFAGRRHKLGEPDAVRGPHVANHSCNLKASPSFITWRTTLNAFHSTAVSEQNTTCVTEISLWSGTKFLEQPKFGGHYKITDLYIRLFLRTSVSSMFLFPLLHLSKRLSGNLSPPEQFVEVRALCSRVQNGFICNVQDVIL